MTKKEDKVALKAFNEDEEEFEEIGVPVEELVHVHDVSKLSYHTSAAHFYASLRRHEPIFSSAG